MIDAYATVLDRTLGQGLELSPADVIYRTYDHGGVASLLPSATSTYKPNTLVDFRALQAPEWAPLLAARLRDAELRGVNGTPHLLIVSSDAGAVVIGDGRGNDLGDGGQILIRSFAQADVSQFKESFWRVGAAAG